MTPFCIRFTLSTDLSHDAVRLTFSLSYFLFVTHSGDGLELCLSCNSNYSSSIDTRILCHCTQIIFQSDIESSPSLHSIGNIHPSATNQLQMALLAQSPTQAQGQGQGQAGTQMPSIKSKHTHNKMHIYSDIPTLQTEEQISYLAQSGNLANLGLPYRADKQPLSTASTMMFTSLGICSSILLSKAVYLDDREFSNTSLTRFTTLSIMIAVCPALLSIFPLLSSYFAILSHHHSLSSQSSFFHIVRTALFFESYRCVTFSHLFILHISHLIFFYADQISRNALRGRMVLFERRTLLMSFWSLL